MSGAITVETGQLRDAARLLSQATDQRRVTGVEAWDFDSAVSARAFDRFERYWTPPRSMLTSSVDAMMRALLSVADAYERRDAEDAAVFSGTTRAV